MDKTNNLQKEMWLNQIAELTFKQEQANDMYVETGDERYKIQAMEFALERTRIRMKIFEFDFGCKAAKKTKSKNAKV